jgi:elongation factor G
VYKDDVGKELDEIDCPADLMDLAVEYREKMVEAAPEADDTLFEKYLEGEKITGEEIKAAIRKGTLAGTICPCLVRLGLQEQGRAAYA